MNAYPQPAPEPPPQPGSGAPGSSASGSSGPAPGEPLRSPALLAAQGLSLHYGDAPAFRGVDLCLPAGSITAVVGPSGCGKSSFLMALNRLSDLVPRCRVEGSVRFDGEEVHSPGCDLLRLRRRVGMIFQKPSPFPFSIRRNLAFPLHEHGVRGRQEVEHRIQRGLEDVGLWDEVRDRLEAPAQSLSGGQQQRLCLARALVLQPQVLLLDEPCSALDPLASGVVEDLILSLRPRLTQLVVTHNLAQARRIADQVAVFWVRDGAGTVIETGSVQQIFRAPQDELTRAYVRGERG